MSYRATFWTVSLGRWRPWAGGIVVLALVFLLWPPAGPDGSLPVSIQPRAATLDPNNALYSVPTEEPLLSFAINIDWGEEFLPAMLDVLDERDVSVTFFPTGRWAELHPELLRELVARGHELGNHGYRHDHPKQLGDDALRAHIERGRRLLLDLTGVTTRLYAPPYGEVDPRIAGVSAATGHWTIMWTLDTIDWQRPPAAVIVQRIVPRVRPGTIVLMHPTAPTLEALPVMIDTLLDAGWRFVPIGRLIETVQRPLDAAVEPTS